MFCSRDTMLYTSQAISGFDPRAIPGCVLWLDGGDNATMNSTTAVTRWNDKSGSGNTMTGTGTWSGGRMVFNGSTNAFSNTTFVFPSSNYSLFAVYSNTTAPASTAYMNVAYGSNGFPMVGVYDSKQYVSARSVVGNTGALTTSANAGWGARMGSTGADSGNGIATDSSGNVFVTGSYSAALTLYNTGGTTGATLTNVGGTDGFLAKYSETGTVSWAAQIAGTTTSGDTANALATDSSGNAFVTGSYGAALTLYNAGGTTGATLASSGSDCFIGKYSPTGTVLWAARILGGGGNGISTDSSGNAFIFGNYGAALTLYSAGGGSSNTLPFVGTTDSFIAKYSSDGIILWAAQIANVVSGRSIATDTSGNAFVTGFYGSSPLTAYSTGGGSSNTLSFSGIYNSFLAKYSSTGSNIWLAQISGSFATADQVATDSSGNVFVAGNFNSTLILYSAGGGSSNTLSANGYDGFIGKYSSAGIIVWSARVSGSGNDDARAVITDLNGNVFLAGYYSAGTTAYNSDGSTGPTLATITGNDCFLVKYSPTGSAIWATRFGGSGSDIAFELTTDSSGNVCVTGNYSSATLTLYNMDGTTGGTLTNAGGNDVFVAKYSPAGFITSGPVPASSNVMVSATYPSPTAMTPFTNGVSMTALAGTTLATTGIYVGGPSNYFNGSVSEVLVFNNTLGSTQRQSVEGYLARKWGLQTLMPTIHPFRSLPPFSRQFSPLDIPGCALWLDGMDGSTFFSDSAGTTPATLSGTVGFWKDKSGSGGNVSNATSGQRPTYTANGLLYAGAQELTGTPPTLGGGGFAAFIVFNPTSASTRSAPVYIWNGYARAGFETTTNNFGNSSLSKYQTVSPIAGTNNIMSLVAYSASQLEWAVNVATSSTTWTADDSLGLGNSFGIGSRGGLVLPFVGTISEVILYNGFLTVTQKQRIEGYLAAKWGLTSSMPGRAPSPRDIPGCALWLDAADASTLTFSSGSNVSQWRDKSSNGCSVYQLNGTPTYTKTAALSLGCVAFNGSTDALSFSSFTLTQPYTVFAVATLNSLANASIAYILQGDDSGSPGGAFFYYNASGVLYLMPWAGITGATSSPPLYFSAGATYLYNAIFNGTSSGVGYNGNFTSGINPGTYGWKNLRLGANWPLTNFQSINVAEVIFYNSSLTTTQRQSIEAYLANKWGITATIATAHPYKTLPPTVSQPAQYSEVSPGNWTYDWQPYLKQLARANSTGVTASFSSNAVTGSGGTGNYGGVLGPNGKVYVIPFNTTFLVSVIDPVTNGYTSNDVSGACQLYGGGVLAPNGNIYLVPLVATTVGLINTTSNTFTSNSVSGTIGGGTFRYSGGVLAPNGNIYCIPREATSIAVITPNLNTVSTFGSSPGNSAYLSGCLGPNGKIYCIPYTATSVGVIDPNLNTFTTTSISGTAPGGGAYVSGCLAPNGKIYCVPANATSVGVIDPVENTFTIAITGTTSGYAGGVLGPDGKIYCIPQGASAIGVIDIVANSFTTFGSAPGGPAYIGGVLAPNGSIYCIPYGVSVPGVISFSGLSQLPSLNYCLSAWTNKL